MAFGFADIVLSLLSLLVLGAAVVVLLRLRDGPAPAGADEPALTDGAVVIASRGRITRVAEEARRLFGDAVGQPLRPAFAAVLGEDRAEALGALERLEQTGEPVRLITHDREGRAVELQGAPDGARLRVVLRDAGLMEARLEAAECELARREEAMLERTLGHDALTALLDGATMIAWSRNPDGTVRWAGGAVAGAAGTVCADALMAGLPRPPRGDGESTARTRVEVTLAPDRTVPVHVVEVVAGDAVHGFAIDATASVSAENTLSRFVQTMTETFAHLTVGLAIFDQNRQLALFNPALVQMWQIEASRLVSRPSLREILDSLRMSRRIPEVEDFRVWRDELLALFDDPEKVDYEALWQLSDGSSIRVLARPHPHGLLAFVFDDVTERMRLEQRFRHSIELRRATLDRLEEGLAVFGADGMLQFMNRAFHRIWGSDSGSFGPTTHVRDVVRFCSAASLEGEVWDRALSFITAEAERRAWSARLTLGSGRILSARVATLPDGASMLVFWDITDSDNMAAALRERNEALESAEEMRTAVLERISHRLRTPLNTLFGFARLLTEQEAEGLNDRQRGFAEGILEAAGQLLDAIDDVTELAALQLEPLHDEATPHRVWETLELVAGLLRERAMAAGATLEVAEADAGGAYLVCDLPALRQIVFVMVAKAIDRAGRGGRVELAARAASETTLEVEAREHAAGRTTTAPEGPALSVLRRMVEAAGGEYRWQAGPGDGEAVGTCRFPDALAPADEAAAEEEPEPDPPELIDDADGEAGAGPAGRRT